MATQVEIADVEMYAPEIVSLSAPYKQTYLDLAKSFVFEAKWERKYKQAVCLLTAHLLTMAQRSGGSPGAIASESVGELSVSYGSVSSVGDELLTTSYGSMYLALRKTLKITPLVV